MPKYKNKKTETEEGTFDSEKEYGRWCDLKWMQKAGQIENLQRQVKFELVPSQRIDGKVVERSITYIADFTYLQDGELVVEDVKPTFRNEYVEKRYKATAGYKVFTIKRKLMLYKYGIQIKEV